MSQIKKISKTTKSKTKQNKNISKCERLKVQNRAVVTLYGRK